MGFGGGATTAAGQQAQVRLEASGRERAGSSPDRRGREDRFGKRVTHSDRRALLGLALIGAGNKAPLMSRPVPCAHVASCLTTRTMSLSRGVSRSTHTQPKCYGACVACLLIGSVAVALARRIALGSASGELLAACLCHLLALPLVGVPLSILIFNSLLPRVLPREACELCAVWLLWNFGWLFYISLIWPFLLSSLGTQHTYADVLYDYTVFVLFIPCPVVLASGMLKAISVRVGWRWGWRQRAVLGTALGTVALCMWAGQYYVRPDGMHAAYITYTYLKRIKLKNTCTTF
jgi:hypothetical protein